MMNKTINTALKISIQNFVFYLGVTPKLSSPVESIKLYHFF